MIEIVFGESACGSLKIAQTYGKGKYRGSAVSIFMRHEDGSVPVSYTHLMSDSVKIPIVS